MLRAFFVLFIMWGVLIFSVVFMLEYALRGLFQGKDFKTKYVYGKSHWWGQLMIWSTGSKVTVSGMENLPKDPNLAFVSNHQGNADIPLILGAMPRLIGFIAKKELQHIPFLSGWMRRMGCMFINRKNIRQASEIIHQAAERLKEGSHSFVIFPEGTRSKGPNMKRFKSGSLKLATLAGVKIVPLTIQGSYRVFEANKGIRMKATHLYLHIHPPIETENLTEEEKKELPDRVYRIIETKLKEIQEGGKRK